MAIHLAPSSLLLVQSRDLLTDFLLHSLANPWSITPSFQSIGWVDEEGAVRMYTCSHARFGNPPGIESALMIAG